MAKVDVWGLGPGTIVDYAQDTSTGEIGYAVQLEGGGVELVCAGMVSPSSSLPLQVNPVDVSIPALGQVELEEAGLDVVALRGEKIPKYQQLSSLLGVPVRWEAKGRVGFVADTPRGPIPLGYSFEDALESARFEGLIEISDEEENLLAAQSDLLKWGALPGTIAAQGGAANPLRSSGSYPYLSSSLVSGLEPVAEKEGVSRVARSERGFPPQDGREGMVVQSLLFPSDEWTEGRAKKWMKGHDYEGRLADHSATQLRYRQIEPKEIEPGTWATIPFGESGIQAVVGIPRGGVGRGVDWRSQNPWGVTRDGQRVFYAREAGPTTSEAFSRKYGGQITYYFPGEAGSPNLSRGGFYLGEQYLGESREEVEALLFGLPWRSILTGSVNDLESYSLPYIASLELSNGDTVLQRSDRFGSDTEKFLASLSSSEFEKLDAMATTAGYPGGVEALHFDLQQISSLFSPEIKSNTFSRYPNPPIYLEVKGPVQRDRVTIETETGEVLSSSFEGMAGLVAGPTMTDQYGLMRDLDYLEKPDFSSPEEALRQFFALDQNVAIAEGPGYDTGEALYDAVGTWLYDPNNPRLEHLRRRLLPAGKGLAEAIKAIVRRTGINRWSDFPLDRLHEIEGLGGLLLPGTTGAAGDIPDRDLVVGMAPDEIERSFSAFQAEDSARFALMRASYTILGYLMERGALEQQEALKIKEWLDRYQQEGRPYEKTEFSQFTNLIKGGLEYAKGEVPF